MKIRFSIIVSAVFFAAATLLVLNDRLHAGPRHPVTACGFWGPMEAGMSCQ
jgi:hypothetical protein